MPGSRLGTLSRSISTPVPRAAGGLAGRAGQPRRAHVLDAGDGAAGEQFEAGFEQQLFAERIAHLHGRAVLLRFLGQVARGERRARQTVAPGLRADVKDRVADALRRRRGRSPRAAGRRGRRRSRADCPRSSRRNKSRRRWSGCRCNCRNARCRRRRRRRAGGCCATAAPSARRSGRSAANSARRPAARPW